MPRTTELGDRIRAIPIWVRRGDNYLRRFPDQIRDDAAAIADETLNRVQSLVDEYFAAETKPRGDHFAGWVRDALEGASRLAVDAPASVEPICQINGCTGCVDCLPEGHV